MIEAMPRDLEKALADLGLMPARPAPPPPMTARPGGWTPAFKGEDPPF